MADDLRKKIAEAIYRNLRKQAKAGWGRIGEWSDDLSTGYIDTADTDLGAIADDVLAVLAGEGQ